MDLNELYETWINGNLSDAVAAIIKDGKLSTAIEFACMLGLSDRKTFLKMLRNRDN